MLNKQNSAMMIPIMGTVPIGTVGPIGTIGTEQVDSIENLANSFKFRVFITVSQMDKNDISTSIEFYSSVNIVKDAEITNQWIIVDEECEIQADIKKSTSFCYDLHVPVVESTKKIVVENTASLFKVQHEPTKQPNGYSTMETETIKTLTEPQVRAACDSTTKSTIFCAIPAVVVSATVDQENKSKWSCSKEYEIIPAKICTRTPQYWAHFGPGVQDDGKSCNCNDSFKDDPNWIENTKWPRQVIESGLQFTPNMKIQVKDICVLLNRPDDCGCLTIVPLLLNRLTQQLVAALFNQIVGVYVPFVVQETINNAQVLLQGYNVLECNELKSKDQSSAVGFTTILEKFNNGLLAESGPHCDDDQGEELQIEINGENAKNSNKTLVQYTVHLNKELKTKKTPQVSFTINLDGISPNVLQLEDTVDTDNINDEKFLDLGTDSGINQELATCKLPYEKQFHWELLVNDIPLIPPVRGKAAVPQILIQAEQLLLVDLTNDDLKLDDKITIKLTWYSQTFDVKTGQISQLLDLDETDTKFTAVFETKVVNGTIVNTVSRITETFSAQLVLDAGFNDDSKQDLILNKSLAIPVILVPGSMSIKFRGEFKNGIAEFNSVSDNELVSVSQVSQVFQDLVSNEESLTIPFSNLDISASEIVLSYLVCPADNVSKLTSTTTVTNITGSAEVHSSSTTTTLVKHSGTSLLKKETNLSSNEANFSKLVTSEFLHADIKKKKNEPIVNYIVKSKVDLTLKT